MDRYIQGHGILLRYMYVLYMYMDIVYVGYGEPDEDTGYSDLVIWSTYIRTCLCAQGGSKLEGGKGL